LSCASAAGTTGGDSADSAFLASYANPEAAWANAGDTR
jgi:hypothetical protein